MAASSKQFSVITGHHIADGETIIAAYRTTYSLRIFFESNEGLREVKQRFGYFLFEEVIEKNLMEKDPNDGATKDRNYFLNLNKRALSTRSGTLPSQEAEKFLESLVDTKARLFYPQWGFIAHKFKKITPPAPKQNNDDEQTPLLKVV